MVTAQRLRHLCTDTRRREDDGRGSQAPSIIQRPTLDIPPACSGGRLGPVEAGRRDEIVQELVVHQHVLVSCAKTV